MQKVYAFIVRMNALQLRLKSLFNIIIYNYYYN